MDPCVRPAARGDTQKATSPGDVLWAVDGGAPLATLCDSRQWTAPTPSHDVMKSTIKVLPSTFFHWWHWSVCLSSCRCARVSEQELWTRGCTAGKTRYLFQFLVEVCKITHAKERKKTTVKTKPERKHFPSHPHQFFFCPHTTKELLWSYLLVSCSREQHP